MVSISSREPNGVWLLNDFCTCIFALPAVSNIIITDYADYFHPFGVRNCLWLLWQAVCRHTGRKWLSVALVLGDSMFVAFLIYMLYIQVVPNPSWTNHNTADNEGSCNFSVLDSSYFVLCYFACNSTI